MTLKNPIEPINKNMQDLEAILSGLPSLPGIYQYFDRSGKIIYIGKAKNLKKRVLSYFTNSNLHSGKTRLLIKRIADIQYMVVDSETDALLLENNLIKKYQPKYNVLLKDDKTYPWICIKSEPFPRIFSTRNPVRDGSLYFGPYASIKMMNALLDLIRRIFPLRNCNKNLSQTNIAEGKYKVCLEYHLKNCKGPCEGKQSLKDYMHNIKEIESIIKGNLHPIIKTFTQIMMDYADKMEFEKAHEIKQKLDYLTHFQSKSTIVSPKIHNVDVFSFVESNSGGFVNFLKVINGAVIQTHTVELVRKLDDPPEQLLAIAIYSLRQKYSSNAPEIIVPFPPADMELTEVKIVIPKIGEKKDLLMLSKRNALYYKQEREMRSEKLNPERHRTKLLETLQQDLGIPSLPIHIECFDNSNFQGDFPVSAMVYFKDGKPYKKGYRHYNIKSVVGPNDFASMEEVVYRRYKRLLSEEASLPQLIIVDGGKGQLSSAYKSLERLNLHRSISLIGIAKRLEEIFKPGDPDPIYLDKKSSSLKLIQHLRDEAHRFGITHHRKRLEKGTIKTELTQIPGIGMKTSTQLLTALKSVDRIKSSSLETLTPLIGKAKAVLVYNYFNPSQESKNRE